MFRKENTLLISLFVLITLCRPISAAFIKSRNHTQASIEALGICVCCKGATRSTSRIKNIRVFSLCFTAGFRTFFRQQSYAWLLISPDAVPPRLLLIMLFMLLYPHQERMISRAPHGSSAWFIGTKDDRSRSNTVHKQKLITVSPKK